MGTISKFSVTVFLLGLGGKQTIAQQLSIDAFGLVPQCRYSHCSSGVGGNMLFCFSDPELNDKAVEIRMGMGGYYCGLQKSTVDNVPLSAPQIGNSTVHLINDVGGLNGILRVSLPYSNILVPYADITAGKRYFSSYMNVVPDGKKYTPSSQTLLKSDQFSYGISLGFLTSFGETVKLDLGVMYSNTTDPRKTLDVYSAHAGSDGLTVNKTNGIKGLFLFRMGLVFNICAGSDSSGGSSSSSGSGGCWLFNSSGPDSSTGSSSSGGSNSNSGGSSTGSTGGGRGDSGPAHVDVHIK